MAKLILTESEHYVFHCTFAERDVPKQAGFRWDSTYKVWHTPDPAVAVRLREYAVGKARHELDRLQIVCEPWTMPLPPPPKDLELLKHQPEAIHFALARNRCYLGLDPGLGKTIIAARISAALPPQPIVYICPPFLTRNVEEEFKKWAPEVTIARYDRKGFRHPVQVLVVPDSLLIKEQTVNDLLSFLKGAEYATLFVDEAHRYKNEETGRTRSLLGHKPKNKPPEPGIIEMFERQIYMSGTPMPNRPMELYPLLSKVAPETINYMNKFDYGRRYCAGYRNAFGWDFLGASNVAELALKVIAPTGPFMLRLKKELLDLPPKLEEVFVISAEMSPRLAAMDMQLEDAYDAADDAIKDAIAASNGREADELHVATYRRHLGEEKIAPAAEYIKSLMEETSDNLLVFAYHKDTIAGLATELLDYSPLVVTGDVPPAYRHEIVKQFQLGRSRIIIGNYQAMGVGFTLTRATRVLFVEFSWVPGENDQASDRAHRIGQKNTVLVQYMVYAGSIDKRVIETLLKKRKSTDQI